MKDAAGAVLGYITRTCSVCSRDYTISDRDRQPILKIAGPCYTPWTFNIRAMVRERETETERERERERYWKLEKARERVRQTERVSYVPAHSCYEERVVIGVS